MVAGRGQRRGQFNPKGLSDTVAYGRLRKTAATVGPRSGEEAFNGLAIVGRQGLQGGGHLLDATGHGHRPTGGFIPETSVGGHVLHGDIRRGDPSSL